MLKVMQTVMLVGAEAWTQVFRLRTVSAAPGCLWVVPDLDVLEREFEESEVSTMRMGCKDQSCVFSSSIQVTELPRLGTKWSPPLSRSL